MKSIKMLVLTALLAMAFVGASSAMAESTGLCKADESPCEVGKSILHVHETTLSGAKATLLNSVSNVLCDALFLGDVEEEGSPEVIGGNFTYTNCVDEKPKSCTVTEESGPAAIEVLKEGHETYSVTGLGQFKVICTGISCKYSGEGLLGTGKGPLLSSETNGEASITGQSVKKISGLLCPNTTKLDITTTPLEEAYIQAAVGWRHVCIFAGTNNGHYLGTDGTGRRCTTRDATKVGSYELGWALRNGLGEHVCAVVELGSLGGLYLSFISATECGNSHATFIGPFELGIVS